MGLRVALSLNKEISGLLKGISENETLEGSMQIFAPVAGLRVHK